MRLSAKSGRRATGRAPRDGREAARRPEPALQGWRSHRSACPQARQAASTYSAWGIMARAVTGTDGKMSVALVAAGGRWWRNATAAAGRRQAPRSWISAANSPGAEQQLDANFLRASQLGSCSFFLSRCCWLSLMLEKGAAASKSTYRQQHGRPVVERELPTRFQPNPAPMPAQPAIPISNFPFH